MGVFSVSQVNNIIKSAAQNSPVALCHTSDTRRALCLQLLPPDTAEAPSVLQAQARGPPRTGSPGRSMANAQGVPSPGPAPGLCGPRAPPGRALHGPGRTLCPEG